MDPKSIWLERQNKPTLIVRDLSQYAPPDVVYGALLRRGVFKWLSVRRDLIRLKNIWKARIRESLHSQDMCASLPKYERARTISYWRGYRKALEECRAEVQALCHSERWQAPDNDKQAQEWLNHHA